MRRNNFKSRRKFERLEDRRMMTGDFDLISDNDDIVTVLGTDNDDEIVIAPKPGDSDMVLITVKDRDTGEELDSYDNEFDDVDKVIVLAGSGNDIVTNITNIPSEISGEGGNDILTGGTNNDTYKFSGLSFGTDEIHEDPNADTDTLDFSEYERGVFVNLDRVFDPNANAPHSTFAVTTFNFGQVKLFNATGIEDVIGTANEDHIRGNSRPNHFWGGDEDDNLEGRGNDDILEGQAGSDIYEFSGTNLGTDEIKEAANSDNDGLRFSGMSAGVTVDISKAGSDFAVNSAALRLRLATDTAIERVWGSQHGDTITGNSRNNTLLGLGGSDTIRGGAGVDTLNGGADDDTLLSDALDEAVFGGTGRDRFDNFFFYESVVDTRNGTPARFKDLGLI